MKDQSLSQDQMRSVRKLRFELDLEEAFAEQRTAATIGRVRVVFTALALFGLLTLSQPRSTDRTIGVFSLVLPAFYLVLLGLAYVHRLRHFATPSLAVAAVLTEVAVGLTTKVSDLAAASGMNVMYLIIVIATLQTRFRIALAFCVALISVRAWNISYRGMWSNDAITLFAFMISGAIFLCLASYLNEMRDRRSFLLERSLVAEKEKSRALVRNVLPPSIADRLSESPEKIAQYHDSATVLFCDIIGFTPFAASKPPETVLGLLNDLFSRFDALLPRFNVVKIKTVGDCYMVASGLPEPSDNHVSQIADMALELRGTANAVGVDVRIGFHTGPVVAGVLGSERLMYDLWGPTVNMAARLESSANPGTIAVSEAVHDMLAESHEFEGPYELDLKGIGPTHVWHLTKRRIRDLTLS